MVASFRRRGRNALHKRGPTPLVAPEHSARLRDSAVAPDTSREPGGMNLPGIRLQPLAGRLNGLRAVPVSGNWSVTFRFDDGSAVDADDH